MTYNITIGNKTIEITESGSSKGTPSITQEKQENKSIKITKKQAKSFVLFLRISVIRLQKKKPQLLPVWVIWFSISHA